MARQDQFKGTLTIDWPGLGNLDTWDVRTGGNRSADTNKYRPGGMGPEKSLGGYPKMGALVLRREYRSDRDHSKIKALYAAVGKADAHYHETPLDADGNPFAGADTVTWNGTLMRVDMPERNSMSQDVAMIEVEIDVDGTIA